MSGGYIKRQDLDPTLKQELDLGLNAFDQAKQYTDAQIAHVAASGIPKLAVYEIKYNGTAGQTTFPITTENFDIDTDTVKLFINSTYISSNRYSINKNTPKELVLNNALLSSSEVVIEIWKHVIVGPEGSINGAVLAVNSIPLNRIYNLEERIDILSKNKIMIRTGRYVITDNELYEVPVPIVEFDFDLDMLTVYHRGLYLQPEIDYTLNKVNRSILKVGAGPWLKDQIFDFVMYKNLERPVPEDYVNGGMILENSIPLIALNESVKTEIQKVAVHEVSEMPHKFTDNGVEYRYGWKAVGGSLQFIYEEVI